MQIIEGRNPVIEALRAGRLISKILIDNGVKTQGAITQILEMARAKGVMVEFSDRQTIEKQGAGAAGQGVIAFAAAKEYVELEDLFAISRNKGEAPLYLILDGLEDPHNLGAIIRTSEATGMHGVVIRERRAVGLTPAVVKASAGAVEYVPIARVTNIAQTITTLKKNNVWVVGVDMAGDIPYTKVDYRAPTAIVIGGEGKGLSELVSKRCDYLASIPMKGKIGSLNASVAAAVVMYEALRQRSE